MLPGFVQLGFHCSCFARNENLVVTGREIPVNTVTKILMEMNVKEKNNDEISIDYSYKEVVMEVSNPMMNIKYDSKNTAESSSEPEKLIAQIFNGLIGKNMNVVFAPDGSVKSISGFDAIMEDIQKNIISANPAIQQMVNAFLQSLNEDAMKQTFEQSFKVYPDKEIKVGDSWDKDISYTAAGILNNIKNTYTLKSVVNDIALLDVVSVSNVKPSAGNGNMEGEMIGGQKSEMSLNVKTGMLINSTGAGSAKGKFTTQGMEILMDTESKVTVNLNELSKY